MKRWSDEEDKLLIELSSSAIGSIKIAEILSRSGDAVRQRASYLKVSIVPPKNRARWTIQEDQKLTNLIKKGKTTQEISLAMSRKAESIINRTNTLGLTELLVDFSTYIDSPDQFEKPDKQDTTLWGKKSLMAMRLPFSQFYKLTED